MKISDFYYLSGIERKAAKQVYIQFRINRYELNMLVGLSTYLRLFGKRIVSKNIFTKWLGLNYRDEKKAGFYIYGLEKKGAIHRLAYRRPDGQSLAISPYGVRILQSFEAALTAGSKNKIQSAYQDLPINLNTLPDGYILKTKGRE